MRISWLEVSAHAEKLKELLWYYLDCTGNKDKKIKDKMNELLDMLGDLDPEHEQGLGMKKIKCFIFGHGPGLFRATIKLDAVSIGYWHCVLCWGIVE